MVGIVIVSHSRRLAEGVAELVRGMVGEEVPLALTGGVDEPDQPLGTDAVAVMEAIESVWSEDGVLVLMDLGSAVLSAETALDLLEEERRENVLLCEAPLVEGALAAAVQASVGAPLDEVAAEARGALGPKAEHLGHPSPPPRDGEAAGGRGPEDQRVATELEVTNPLGLHARPAVRFVETAGRFEADVWVRNLSTGAGPARGRSLNALATLGVRRGHRIGVEASGPEAAGVLEALEHLADEGFGDRAESPPSPVAAAAPEGPTGGLAGLAAGPGIAIGEAVPFRPPEIRVPDREAGEPEEERRRLAEALRRVEAEVEAARRAAAGKAGEYEAAIFDAHRLMLRDEELVDPVRRSIEEGATAEAAWRRVTDEAVGRYRALEDEYQRARAADLEGLARQVLVHLVGEQAVQGPELERPGVLVARDLTPAETARLDPSVVLGIATAHGSPTSHAAVLARAMGVPAVVAVGEALLEVAAGTTLIVDGGVGAVIPDPDEETLRAYRERRERAVALRREVEEAAGKPAVTRNGVEVEVAANVGEPGQALEAVASGADGVGLLRTEFLFLGRRDMPDEEEQYRAYREIAEAMGDRPVILRTLDVGGDKPLPYVRLPEEANPFLGLRGIRLALARPDLLRPQLRAVARVAKDHPWSVMFPMVTRLDELRRAKAMLDDEGGGGIPVGVMVETPALALMADRFAPEVAFFSVGTNDLTQYVMAAERGNPAVASLGDALDPAVLRLLARVVEAADGAGIRVGVCGELAGHPSAVPILVGLGVRELSMSPPAVPAVKAAVREIDTGEAEDLARRALELESADAVRELLGH